MSNKTDFKNICSVKIKMKKYLFLTIVILFIFVFSFQTFAHSGRTDSYGGHYDHSNGSYHYHHGHPAHEHPNGECPYIQANKDSQTNDNQKMGFWGTLITSIFIGGWFGGALLLAVLFWPLKLIFNDFFEDNLFAFQFICSVITSILLFVYISLLN